MKRHETPQSIKERAPPNYKALQTVPSLRGRSLQAAEQGLIVCIVVVVAAPASARVRPLVGGEIRRLSSARSLHHQSQPQQQNRPASANRNQNHEAEPALCGGRIGHRIVTAAAAAIDWNRGRCRGGSGGVLAFGRA